MPRTLSSLLFALASLCAFWCGTVKSDRMQVIGHALPFVLCTLGAWCAQSPRTPNPTL